MLSKCYKDYIYEIPPTVKRYFCSAFLASLVALKPWYIFWGMMKLAGIILGMPKFVGIFCV